MYEGTHFKARNANLLVKVILSSFERLASSDAPLHARCRVDCSEELSVLAVTRNIDRMDAFRKTPPKYVNTTDRSLCGSHLAPCYCSLLFSKQYVSDGSEFDIDWPLCCFPDAAAIRFRH